MSSRITLSQIVDNITQLSASVKPDDFIYDFLACFGLPKATIARLKGGGLNVAKKDGCTLLKTKVYFEPVRADLLKTASPRQAIEVAQKDPKVAANKPRFLIATDFKTVTAFDTKRKDSVEFPIGDLHEHYTFFLPLAGMEKSTVHAEAEADVKAAENMAKLYDLIRADNPPATGDERHALNIFLTRLLFCYFAEDTGIFPDKAFTSAVESYTQADGSDLSGFLRQLFLALNTAPESRGKTPKHLTGFPYVNGGLFRDTHTLHSVVPSFSIKSRQKLIELGQKSWREINPDIFGSMFQGVVDDEKRAELGMHYTSVPNIMKVIKPLFLDELYGDFEKAKGSAGRLNKLLARIYLLRLFDPACGSGNFLIIAYKELRRLEMAIYKELLLLTGQLPFSFSGIQVSQFYGIELDDFAHEIAILALWLAEHQMNIEFTAAFETTPASLPLKDGARIVCGNATQLNWEAVCPKAEEAEVLIIGNPPYIGSKLQKPEQKQDIRGCLAKLGTYKDLDYIACWFVKASDYIQGTNSKYAFVTTNSINQGVQVELLWNYIFSLRQEIFFAIKNFRWQNNAKNKATVTCSIIGLRTPSSSPKKLYIDGVEVGVSQIGPYLIAGTLTIIGRRTEPLSALPKMDMGNQKFDDGHLVLSKEQRSALIDKHPEIERFIRPLIGTTEFIESTTRYCFWIKDAELHEALKFQEISAAVDAVEEYRKKSTDAGTRKLANRSHQFRDTNTANTHSLLVSRTSSENRRYLPCGFLDKEVIIADAQAIYDAELWIFSITSSRMHYLWAKTVGGGLETRIRYSSTICYNNFPFPIISESQKKELERLGELILIERAKFPGKSIAWLYAPDSMPGPLQEAHQFLDEAIEQCYRQKPFTTDEERLEYLFNRYEQMAASNDGELFSVSPVKKTKAPKNNTSFHA